MRVTLSVFCTPEIFTEVFTEHCENIGKEYLGIWEKRGILIQTRLIWEVTWQQMVVAE